MSKAQDLLDRLEEGFFSRAKEALDNMRTRLDDRNANRQSHEQTFGKYDNYMKAQRIANGTGAVNRAQRVFGKAKDAFNKRSQDNLSAYDKHMATPHKSSETFRRAKEILDKYVPDQRSKYRDRNTPAGREALGRK